MMIIDSGVHIWLPEGPDRKWMPGRTAHLPEQVTYEKFSGIMKDAAGKLFTEEMPFLSHRDKEWIMGKALARCLEWPAVTA